MGQIKNIKLHIVTDIKKQSKMLSRLSATRTHVRPVLSAIQVRNAGNFGVGKFYEHEEGKVESTETAPIDVTPYSTQPWRDTAWPFLAEYKSIAGQSAGPVLGFGLATYIVSTGTMSGGLIGLLGIQAFNYYHIYRLAQTPAKNYFKAEQQKWMDYLYSKDQAKLVDWEAKIAEVAYRKRLLEVETEIKKRLDYQVEMQNVQRAIEEKHIAAWVEKEVLKSIAEQKDEDTFQACINNLEEMAAAKATA